MRISYSDSDGHGKTYEDPEAELPDALLWAVVAVVPPVVAAALVVAAPEVAGVVAVPFKQVVGPE
jgi:hypothetical protein